MRIPQESIPIRHTSGGAARAPLCHGHLAHDRGTPQFRSAIGSNQIERIAFSNRIRTNRRGIASLVGKPANAAEYRSHGQDAHGTSSRRSGFTLLELLVAMAMVAILAVSLYASIQITFRAQKRAEAAVAPARTAQLALEMIGQDLTNAISPPASTNTQLTNLAGNFEGTTGADDRGHEADDINFYSTADSPQHVDANGEIKNIELTVITPQNSTDHVLVRRVTRNLLTVNGTAATPDPEFVCGHVNSFTVEYFDGTDWETAWDSTAEDNTLPVAIQVTLNIDLDDPASPGGVQTSSYTRIFPVPCSTAEFDSAVNPSASGSSAQ